MKIINTSLRFKKKQAPGRSDQTRKVSNRTRKGATTAKVKQSIISHISLIFYLTAAYATTSWLRLFG